jgi:hypothetical protein
MQQEHFNNRNPLNVITELCINNVLDGLKRTAAGLDNIPAWFLKIGARFFAFPIAIVFQAIDVSRLSYASPAWWGFASVSD